jgi:hypothetical protein
MTLREAVERTPGLENAWRKGLQALTALDKKHIRAEDTRRLCGSVHLDATLEKEHANANRWDYGAGHQPANRENGDEVVYWIGVHPASDRGGERSFRETAMAPRVFAR